MLNFQYTCMYMFILPLFAGLMCLTGSSYAHLHCIHVCLGCVHVHVHTQCTYMYIVCLACTFLSWHEYFQCQGNKSPYLDMPRLVHTLLPLPEKQTNTCTWVQAMCTCTCIQHNVAYNICIGIDLWPCVHYIQFLSMFICLNRKQETRELTESYIQPNTYMYIFHVYTCICTLVYIVCTCYCIHVHVCVHACTLELICS